MLFHAQNLTWIKADNTPMTVPNNSCFDDCVEFLIFSYFVFNVCYPSELKIVFGVLENIMNIPPTMKRSASVDDFLQQMLQE